jgi:hypothetical protein
MASTCYIGNYWGINLVVFRKSNQEKILVAFLFLEAKS